MEYEQISKQADIAIKQERTYVPNYRARRIKEDLPYDDVTQKWLKKATPDSQKIILDDYFMTDDGIKHPIKYREKISIATIDSKEYKMAELLEKTLGGTIHLIPRIETQKGYKGLVKVSTPDYRWNGSRWDLKTPGLEGKFENSLERFLKKKNAKIQAKKYIINYSAFIDKTDSEILKVVEDTLRNRNWVESLIVVKDKRIIKIYLKK